MDDNVGKYYIENGRVKESKNSIIIGPNDGIMIYDVIRIIDGIPLFFEDHYERSCQSFNAIGNKCAIDALEMNNQIHKIADLNNNQSCNIKFIMFSLNGTPKTIGYISKSYYPTQEETMRGVKVGLFFMERENPNIKLVNNDYRAKVNKIKKEKDLFEIFLIDREGNVNEGGTSNIFFIKEGNVYTAPEEKVLKGITRMHVIKSCEAIRLNVIETAITLKNVWESDAVFLSGTSPKVMPVSSIDDMNYDSANHPIVTSIRNAFDEKIEKYISAKKIRQR